LTETVETELARPILQCLVTHSADKRSHVQLNAALMNYHQQHTPSASISYTET